jgi:hypothetical protein
VARLRDWQGEIGPQVRRLNAKPARAEIGLQAMLSPEGSLAVSADAAARTDQAALYLALTESGLGSKVTRGENSGETLAHDHVAREWIGPLALKDGRLQARQSIALPPAWKRDHLALVAFVQDQRSGEILQALSAPGCALP